MIKNYSFILFIAFFIISGCSGDDDQTNAPPASNTSTTTNKEHFASDLKRSMDQAEGVEQLLQQGTDQRQREIDAQTQQ